MTRPAKVSSRSSHEARIGPPYTSTPACAHPTVASSGAGLRVNPGESVWEPMIRNPESGDASSGTHHAMTAPPRISTCPPGVASHGADSSWGRKSASMSRSATTRAAW